MDQCWLRRFAQVPNHAPDVGFGSLADLNQSMFDVRYSPAARPREGKNIGLGPNIFVPRVLVSRVIGLALSIQG
jgi:hypothetical protein